MIGSPTAPILEIKKVYTLAHSKPFAPSPGCPFLISLTGTITVNGTLTPSSAESAATSAKGSFSKDKVELEQAVKTEFCEVKFKEEVEGGKELSQIGIELGREDFPLTIELAAHANFREPISVGVKWPDAIKIKSREIEVPGSSGFAFSGTVDPQLDIGITMNLSWPGWKNVLQLLARQSSSVLRTGAYAVRGVFIAGEAGTVSAAGVAAVATGVFLCGVAWTAFGLYSIAKASRDGRSVGIRYAFSNGYAYMLSDLTSTNMQTPSAAGKALLDISSWKDELAKVGSEYLIGGGGSVRELMLSNQIARLGSAALFHDVDKYIKTPGVTPWATVSRAQRRRYGEDDVHRKRAYISILYHQVQAGADPLGVALT